MNDKKEIKINRNTLKNFKISFVISFLVISFYQLYVKEIDYNSNNYYNDKGVYIDVNTTNIYISFPNNYHYQGVVISDGTNFAGFIQGMTVMFNCFVSTFYSIEYLLGLTLFLFFILYLFQKFSIKIE